MTRSKSVVGCFRALEPNLRTDGLATVFPTVVRVRRFAPSEVYSIVPEKMVDKFWGLDGRPRNGARPSQSRSSNGRHAPSDETPFGTSSGTEDA